MTKKYDGHLQIEIYAFGEIFQWLVIDQTQQRMGHHLIVAQGSDTIPWVAEAAAQQARLAALGGSAQAPKTRLQEIRIARGMTVAELARKTGLPLETVQALDDGTADFPDD